MTGFDEADILGKTCSVMQGPETSAETIATIGDALDAGEPISIEILNYRKSGETFWNDLSITPIRDHSGIITHFTGVTRNASARIAAEHAIAKLESDYRFMFDHVQAAIVLHAASTEILYANAMAAKLLGVGVEAMQGAVNTDPRWAFLCEDDSVMPITDYPVNKAVAQQSVINNLVLGNRRISDGKLVWLMCNAYPIFDEEGALIQVLVSFTDVTTLKETERKLQKSEERFRIVASATNDVVWDYDADTHDTWWSEGISTQFGYEAIDPKTGFDFWVSNIHPDDQSRVLALLHERLSGTGDVWEAEYRFLRADRSIATVYAKGSIVRDRNGAATRMLGSLVDVTERRELDEKLRQSQKLESIGHLTGGLAHDFNNLLTVILGSAETLVDELHDRPHLYSLASLVISAAERGSELTSQLLAFARRQPLTPKPVDVNTMLTGMEKMLRRTVTEDVEIKLVTGSAVWSISADQAQLETAILNLVINARHAMTDHGQIVIETENVQLDADYAANNVEVVPGQYVLVAVTDTGIGMDKETIAKIFEPFFTTKEAGHGSGLGLSMVYGFVKQSGGHIKVYSECGQGTTFKLYFPRNISNPHEPLVHRTQKQLTGGTEHILVVEDDDLVRDHATALLRSMGYTVTSAPKGDDAIAILRAPGTIDLLFTDIVMPGGMNGRQLADEALRIRPELKILFTSGYTQNAIVHQGRLDEGVQLLSKPYRRDQLALKVREVIDG